MMAAGHAVMLWFIASGTACVLLLAWAAMVGLGTGRSRALTLTLLVLTGALAVLLSGLGRLRGSFAFSYTQTLFIGATLILLAAVVVLWRMRRDNAVRRSADLGIAACLNLWLALWATLTPLSYL